MPLALWLVLLSTMITYPSTIVELSCRLAVSLRSGVGLKAMDDNGLDDPYTPPFTDQMGQAVPNGAYYTAPLTGYALSESSGASNLVSGMSSCTLEGYLRFEPSPSGSRNRARQGRVQKRRLLLLRSPLWPPCDPCGPS